MVNLCPWRNSPMLVCDCHMCAVKGHISGNRSSYISGFHAQETLSIILYVPLARRNWKLFWENVVGLKCSQCTEILDTLRRANHALVAIKYNMERLIDYVLTMPLPSACPFSFIWLVHCWFIYRPSNLSARLGLHPRDLVNKRWGVMELILFLFSVVLFWASLQLPRK